MENAFVSVLFVVKYVICWCVLRNVHFFHSYNGWNWFARQLTKYENRRISENQMWDLIGITADRLCLTDKILQNYIMRSSLKRFCMCWWWPDFATVCVRTGEMHFVTCSTAPLKWRREKSDKIWLSFINASVLQTL